MIKMLTAITLKVKFITVKVKQKVDNLIVQKQFWQSVRSFYNIHLHNGCCVSRTVTFTALFYGSALYNGLVRAVKENVLSLCYDYSAIIIIACYFIIITIAYAINKKI